jgi:drug/metabolite transporter (DMT)-like permease
LGGLIRSAAGYALITGLFIAAYTLWDKQAVSHYAIAPLVLDWGANVGRSILLTPFAFIYSDQAIDEWREHKWAAIAIAILIPLSYILVLTVMRFTPVSYVAPAREISILIGTAMGARLLAEGDAPRRLGAAGAMVLGVALTLVRFVQNVQIVQAVQNVPTVEVGVTMAPKDASF